MQIEEEAYLAHYGILRKSGRYPWGSGANPSQRSKSFLDIVDGHRKSGLSDAAIADLYQPRDANGKKIPPFFTTSDLRALKSRSVNMQKQEQIRRAQTLKDKGYGESEIARQMSSPEKQINESTVRSLLAPGRKERLDILNETADMLKRQVEEKNMIDVGSHVELGLPLGMNEVPVAISKDKFNTALSMLKEEGYSVVTFKAKPQVGTGEQTTRRVLLKPGLTQKDAFLNQEKIQLISEKTTDGGRSYQDALFKKPLSIDPKRVAVRYAEEGGRDADGVIYVRPGVHDVSLGKSQYAQVRIAVGDTHFLKGMAVYKDDLPHGVDLMFNTNKSNTGNKLDALKPLKTDQHGNVDWKNPFGAFPKLIGGQLLDEHGNVKSSMNILNGQGDWDKWANTLSSQMLSKQQPKLAESQLNYTYDRRRQEFEKIKELTNPLIKKTLLETFADETDSSAVHLKAANMPRQATKVILPVSTLKPDEVFAPTFKDGEKVALIRFPHAGTFEIPELTVNNRNREGRRLFSNDGKKIEAPDAIGIHPKVAEHLSGADFDGDHVVVIPNNRGLIKNSPPLEGLKGFDPQAKYPPYDGMKTITSGIYNAKTGEVDHGTFPDGRKRPPKSNNKGTEMGKITNLISDMTVKGATDSDLAAAVRHSMVVIDAEKHHLDYKASERENGILALKKRYQGVNEQTGQVRGASTLTTRATSELRVPKRKDALIRPGLARLSNATVDIKTGAKVYDLTNEKDKQGNIKKFRSRKLAETNDAFTLVSDHGGRPIERIYAEHSNKLKLLANEVRKEAISVPKFKRSPSAAKIYEPEVQQLKAKLRVALKNAPLERQAQSLANEIIGQRRRANPDMEKSELKKIRGQVLEEARTRTGAKKHRVDITDREWEAIQARAVSAETLGKILRNTDVDKLRERATPKAKPVMDSSRMSLARALLNSGATQAEVADRLGVSISTLKSSLADGGG
jgi:hypothetical protein